MTYDVVVLGGGIIGASSAYALAREGARVALLEPRQFGLGASGRSAAMLEFQLDAYRGNPFAPLASASAALFPALYRDILERTGIDFRYERCGILQLAFSEEEVIFLRSEADRQIEIGLNAQWLNSEELNKKFPQLLTDHLGGVLFKDDGQVNGDEFLRAMLEGARRSGATVFENAGAPTLNVASNRIQSIDTAAGHFTAATYVVAAGAWTDQVLAPLGIHLGIKPVRGQLLVYSTPGERLLPLPVYTKANGYIVPKTNGTTLVGTTVEHVGFDESTTESARANLALLGQSFVKGLSNAPSAVLTAGLRPGSPDALPFIGYLPESDNVLVAAGHYRNGVLLAPITAELVADLALGLPPVLDPSPFSPARAVRQIYN